MVKTCTEIFVAKPVDLSYMRYMHRVILAIAEKTTASITGSIYLVEGLPFWRPVFVKKNLRSGEGTKESQAL